MFIGWGLIKGTPNQAIRHKGARRLHPWPVATMRRLRGPGARWHFCPWEYPEKIKKFDLSQLVQDCVLLGGRALRPVFAARAYAELEGKAVTNEREIPSSEWAYFEPSAWDIYPLPSQEEFGMWHEWYDCWLMRQGPEEPDAQAEEERKEEKQYRGRVRRGRRKKDGRGK